MFPPLTWLDFVRYFGLIFRPIHLEGLGGESHSDMAHSGSMKGTQNYYRQALHYIMHMISKIILPSAVGRYIATMGLLTC